MFWDYLNMLRFLETLIVCKRGDLSRDIKAVLRWYILAAMELKLTVGHRTLDKRLGTEEAGD